jgi:hypothetical protein
MFELDSLVLDLVFPASARPTGAQLLEGLGGEEVARSRTVVDVDVDVPQIEMEISPTFMLRRQGERRLYLVDESNAPMRKNPRTDPIVPRDLRPEKERLINLVEKTGARFGRMGAFGTWGDAVWVTRSARDLRALALISWAIDPQTDDSGRRTARPLGENEFRMKLSVYDKRLDELDDATVLLRVPAGCLEQRGDLIVVSALSDRDGSWDIRKSYEIEKKIAAMDLFARIPGARQSLVTAAGEPAPDLGGGTKPAAPASGGGRPGGAGAAAGTGAAGGTGAASRPGATAVPAAPAATAASTATAAPASPPRPAGPPITAVELDGRLVLKIPAERFDLDAAAALGRHKLDLLTSADQVSGKDRERIHQSGCGFLAPLAFLSEVFIDGKPLDRKRFEAEARPVAGGRALEAHLPRFGPVLVLDLAGKRWVTSEVGADPAKLVPLLAP